MVRPSALRPRPFLLSQVCRRRVLGKGESSAVLLLRADVHPHRAAALSVRVVLPKRWADIGNLDGSRDTSKSPDPRKGLNAPTRSRQKAPCVSPDSCAPRVSPDSCAPRTNHPGRLAASTWPSRCLSRQPRAATCGTQELLRGTGKTCTFRTVDRSSRSWVLSLSVSLSARVYCGPIVRNNPPLSARRVGISVGTIPGFSRKLLIYIAGMAEREGFEPSVRC